MKLNNNRIQKLIVKGWIHFSWTISPASTLCCFKGCIAGGGHIFTAGGEVPET